jgi:predicted AlkP superfamily pyrophosphatase or phosphodiesterase
MSSVGESMGVLLILIDAFSYQYLNQEYTPFLSQMADDGALKPLAPMFAFRGIEATIFTGEWPPVHNVWTEFKLRTKHVHRVSSRLLSKGLGFLDKIGHERLSKFSRLGITMMSNLSIARLTPSMIPGKFLLVFEPSMRKQVWHPKSLRVPTVFDWLRSRGERFVCMERIPPLLDDFGTVKRFERLILRQKPSFAWVKLNALDTAGHVNGPNVSLLREDLIQIDALTKELVESGHKAGLHHVVVMSDHGMSFVKEWHDPQPLLDQLGADGIFFLDSTMARFWFQSQSQKEKSVDGLSSLPYGRILTSKEMAELKVPTDPTYGELIFALNEGHVFLPDFWNCRKKVKGMHGYAFPKSKSAVSFLLSNEVMAPFAPSKNKNVLEFSDIFPWIMRGLESDAS